MFARLPSKGRPLTSRTTGQIEAAACDVVTRFHHATLGRGPRTITATLRSNTLFVELNDVLTTSEQMLVKARGANHARGVEMIREMRNHLVRQARCELLAALSGTIGTRADRMLHDIDPASGSEVIVFHLADGLEPTRRRA